MAGYVPASNFYRQPSLSETNPYIVDRQFGVQPWGSVLADAMTTAMKYQDYSTSNDLEEIRLQEAQARLEEAAREREMASALSDVVKSSEGGFNLESSLPALQSVLTKYGALNELISLEKLKGAMKPDVTRKTIGNEYVEFDEAGNPRVLYRGQEKAKAPKTDKGRIVTFNDPLDPLVQRKYKMFDDGRMVPIVEPGMPSAEAPQGKSSSSGNPTLQRKRVVME